MGVYRLQGVGVKKITPNSPCPCGSRTKYKKCCAKYHKGAYPTSALLLMKSRYSAYATGNIDYIIDTTHPDNTVYTTDTDKWKASIDIFCQDTEFLGLKIVGFEDGESEAYVSFVASLSSCDMAERSRFIKEENRWLYESGVIY